MIAEVIVDIVHNEVDRIFDYICDDNVSVGMRVTVPFARGTATGFVIKLKPESDVPASKLKAVLRVEQGAPALKKECLDLAFKLSARYLCPKALVLRLFLPAEMRRGAVRESYRTSVKLLDPEAVFSPRAKRQEEIVAFLKDNGGEADAAFLRERFGTSPLESLTTKGIVRMEKKRVMRGPYLGLSKEPKEKPDLTAAQARAVDLIEGTDKTVALLFGVTGSGKTEVYLRLIESQLKRGKTAIFLVPEISLTPQMLSQLRARFGEAAAILHSGLSAGERFDEWQRLQSGAAKIAIGARSAVFAPLENVGLIVIDEEHDPSYISERAPRYNTFDVAYFRARYNHCKLVLGSATPSVETFRRAELGEFELVRLQERINLRPMPEVTIVDMRREIKRGNPSPFSGLLRDKLEAVLREGNQAILFLNRRGYSRTVLCRDCGYVAKCEHCDVTLTYHSDENCLKCHYCGAKYKMLSACPSCGGTQIRYAGVGTQRVERELHSLFPTARILRMDNDTTSGKEGHFKILKEFSSRNADILIGTQMVAKGHDFPFVTLVGILDADMSLHFPDYRSGERTFQLITQVAGRSGRAQARGEVVLQTFDPENYILRFAADYDYMGFYRYEIGMRQGTAFPPFAKIVRVLVSGEDEKKTLDVLRELYENLKQLYTENTDSFLFFNRMHAPVKRIADRFRYQILMRLSGGELLSKIYPICDGVAHKDVFIEVEEDPSNLN